MKRRLDRLLHIRTLLEDRSRLALETRVAATRALELAARRERQLGDGNGAAALRLLTAGEDTESWLQRIADGEILRWKETRLRAFAEASQAALEEARAVLLAHRLERRQVEALLALARRAEEKEAVRREQTRTDDWFQSGSSAGKRPRK